MPCIDCLSNCPDNITDKCITVTVDDSELLGTCKNTSLFTVLKKIITINESYSDGSGISISGLTGCTLVPLTSGNVKDLIQAVYTGICSLDTRLDEVEDSLIPTITFDTACLTGLPTSPTRDDILKATVTKTCSLDSRVTSIENTYIKTTDVCSVVQNCITGSASTDYKDKMVPYVAYPYFGPLSNFDSSGTGITANGFSKVYLCVGQTIGGFPLPDGRGRSFIGANINVPGGSLDSAVDPSNPQNSGYGFAMGNKKGSFTHSLTITEEAPHTHSVNDPGHSHDYNTFTTANGGSLQNGFATNHSSNYNVQESSTEVTGITIGSAGGGQPHNNTHPVVACVYIMYIP